MAHPRKSVRLEDYGGSEHFKQMERQGFKHIHLNSPDLEARFVALMGRTMGPTRCIDHQALTELGLSDGIKELLNISGCPGVFHICEHSYRCITLEFLASFRFNEAKEKIYFRLFNSDQTLTLKQWGRMLGCSYKGEKSAYSPRDGTNFLYRLLTGRNREEEDPNSWKFKANFIHHPLLRLWCRLVGNIYFSRHETNNLKAHEVHMLFSLLNADGGEPFKVNVAYHIAKHLEQIASGNINSIYVGALVTHIAKALFDNVNEVQLTLAPGDSAGAPNTLSINCLVRMKAIRRTTQGTFWWKVGNTNAIKLPSDNLAPVIPLPPTPFDDIDQTYYLILQTAAPQQHEQVDAEDDADEIVQLIQPINDYGRYNHYPFTMETYENAGLDTAGLPPTFATYPQFREPDTWNANSRDSMMFGLCNQVNQIALDQSIAGHHNYAYHVEQGHYPADSTHPSYYNPQPEQPSRSRHSSVSGADRLSSIGTRVGGSQRHDVSHHSTHRHSSAADSDRTWGVSMSNASSSHIASSSYETRSNRGASSSSGGPALHSAVSSANPSTNPIVKKALAANVKRSWRQRLGRLLGSSSSSSASSAHDPPEPPNRFTLEPILRQRTPDIPARIYRPPPTREWVEQKIMAGVELNAEEYEFMANLSNTDAMDVDSEHTATFSQPRFRERTPDPRRSRRH